MKKDQSILVDAEILVAAVQTIKSHHPEWMESEAWLTHLAKLVEIEVSTSPSSSLGLSHLFSTYQEIDETELTGRISDELEGLRTAYRKDPSQFSEQAVNQLKIVNSYIQTANDFEMCLEDAAYIVDRNDADDLSGRLEALAGLVDEKSRLFLRIQKEVRELAERRRSLPPGAERQQSRKLAQARFTLEAQKKICGHKGCDSMLTLREGSASFFWGCKNFPECWGRRPLTKDEQKLLSTI